MRPDGTADAEIGLSRIALAWGQPYVSQSSDARIEGGTFTPLLWELPVGHAMRMIGPKGRFMLMPEDARTHIFISSGTGNAPFVAMMRQLLLDGAPRSVVFLNFQSRERSVIGCHEE